MASGAECPGCGGNAVRHIGPLPDSEWFAGTRAFAGSTPRASLHRCDICLLAFRLPAHSPEALEHLYAAGDPDVWTPNAARRPDWELGAEWVATELPATVLDVGCFDGHFADYLPDGIGCYGVEANPAAAQRAAARGVSVVSSSIEELTQLDQRFTHVVAFDVIEHVPNPLGFLRQLCDLVEPGGSIVIGTGNFDALAWRLMGSSYWYCCYPEHVAFISPRWCAEAARTLELEIAQCRRIRRGRAGIRRIVDLALNASYRFGPAGLSTWLRSARMSRRQQVAGPAAAVEGPPAWFSARDHIVVQFRAMPSNEPSADSRGAAVDRPK